MSILDPSPYDVPYLFSGPEHENIKSLIYLCFDYLFIHTLWGSSLFTILLKTFLYIIVLSYDSFHDLWDTPLKPSFFLFLDVLHKFLVIPLPHRSISHTSRFTTLLFSQLTRRLEPERRIPNFRDLFLRQSTGILNTSEESPYSFSSPYSINFLKYLWKNRSTLPLVPST